MRAFNFNIERIIKLTINTHSFDFACNCKNLPSEQRKVKWNGHPIYYRTGTSDVYIMRHIIFAKKPEYQIQFNGQTPNVILDIGGNIGIASIFFASLFPQSIIYSIEPVPANYELLIKNISSYQNIKPFNLALGSSNTHMPMYPYKRERNHGGFSLFKVSEQLDKPTDWKIEVRNTAEFLQENNITQFDLLKIDTEDAEYDIITSIPEEIIKKTRWIVGELHGNKDYELLNYLSQWFTIGLHKDHRRTTAIFNMYNKLINN